MIGRCVWTENTSCSDYDNCRLFQTLLLSMCKVQTRSTDTMEVSRLATSCEIYSSTLMQPKASVCNV